MESDTIRPHPVQEAEPWDLDVVVMGSLFVELTPERAGEPLQSMERMIPLAAGAAANFAAALSALGARVGVIGAVGADVLGDWALARLHQRGIDTQGILRSEDQLTPLSIAWVDLLGGKEFLFYRFPGHSDPLAALSPAQLDPAQSRRGRIFDFTEAVIRSPLVRQAAFQAARWAAEAGSLVVYAANLRPDAWSDSPSRVRAAQREAIELAEVVIMNEEEKQYIFRDECLDNFARKSKSGRTIFVTAGDKGGRVYTPAGPFAYAAPCLQVAYDVGAGDAFHAGVVGAYLRGYEARAAAALGAACAGLRISRPPSSPPSSWDEVLAQAQVQP